MDARRQLYWDLHDFSVGRGLEIGPLVRALVPRDEADVRYVDVHDQAGLRAHYNDEPSVPNDEIPYIDYTLIKDDGRTVSLVEAAAEGAPFSWVVASHVIEHVPDAIGWLADLAELVEDDGVLVLAVPDKRYCFDVHRPATSVGVLLQAHLSHDTRPSVRAVYDHCSRAVDQTSQTLWAGQVPTYERRIHSISHARDMVQKSLDGAYIDCHVWLFTPDSFLEQMHELRTSGLSSWVVEQLEPTPRDDLEFRVRLRRIARGVDATAPQAAEVVSEGERPDWLEEQMLGWEMPELRRTIAELERQVRSQQERLVNQQERLIKVRGRLAKVKSQAERSKRRQRRIIRRKRMQLDALKSSWQWRAGAVVVTPARGLRQRVKNVWGANPHRP